MNQPNLFDLARCSREGVTEPEHLPYQPHSETSKQAAKSLPNAGTLRAAVLHYLTVHGPSTDEEMQQGIPMASSTQRPRRIELVERGLVRDSGRKRKTSTGRSAVIWETTK